MSLTFLKYQFRQGLFLVPLIVIPIELIFKVNVIVFFFLQTRFFNVFQQKDFHLLQLHVCGTKLNPILKWYNLSWAMWFNFWFFTNQTIQVLFFENSIQKTLIETINFNTLLFMSFVVGNMLSNSDLITVKNRILRYFGLSFIYTFSISAIYSICLFINSYLFWYNVFLLVVIVQLWQYTSSKQNRIKYINYYL